MFVCDRKLVVPVTISLSFSQYSIFIRLSVCYKIVYWDCLICHLLPNHQDLLPTATLFTIHANVNLKAFYLLHHMFDKYSRKSGSWKSFLRSSLAMIILFSFYFAFVQIKNKIRIYVLLVCVIKLNVNSIRIGMCWVWVCMMRTCNSIIITCRYR